MNMKRSLYSTFGEQTATVANALMLLSRGRDKEHARISTPSRRSFECKTCNKRFPSFQALGGHRASHKKPKPSADGDRSAAGAARPKVHECSICGLEFATGQALGGHMRRHRAAAEGVMGNGFVEKKSSSNGKRVMLDLNLPPLEEAMEDGKLELGLGLIKLL